VQIRQLGPTDVDLLEKLAQDDADFDIDGRGGQEKQLTTQQLHAFLSDPTVLFWCAFADDSESTVLGFLHCQTIRKYSSEPMEVLLYQIGVRSSARRQGIGRALMMEMEHWMSVRHIEEVWVLGDNPVAVDFYKANGFEGHAPEAAVYLTKELTRS
jgi:ribosomal protein S18 acetylase RimI-like enzyme